MISIKVAEKVGTEFFLMAHGDFLPAINRILFSAAYKRTRIDIKMQRNRNYRTAVYLRPCRETVEIAFLIKLIAAF